MSNRSDIADQVLQAQAKLRDEILTRPDPAFWGEVALSCLAWAPTVDNETIPKRPIECIAEGSAADIDLLVGSNTEETGCSLSAMVPSTGSPKMPWRRIARAYGLSAEGLSTYRAAHPGASAGELFSAIQTDWYWRIPAVRMADAHARTAHSSSKTFMYELAWRSPQFGGRLGAAHSVEIPFVFDTLGLGTEPLLGSNPPQSLATEMHTAWVGFAGEADCGWPKYDVVRRSTMHLDMYSEWLRIRLPWSSSVGRAYAK